MGCIISCSAQKVWNKKLVIDDFSVCESSCSFGLNEDWQENHVWENLLDVKVEICKIQTGGSLFKRMRDAVRFTTPTESFAFIMEEGEAISVINAVRNRREIIRQKAEEERIIEEARRAQEAREAEKRRLEEAAWCFARIKECDIVDELCELQRSGEPIPSRIKNVAETAYAVESRDMSKQVAEFPTEIPVAARRTPEDRAVVVGSWCFHERNEPLGASYYLGKVIVPDGYIAISAHAFNGVSNLYSVSLPRTLTYIGAKAFRRTDIRFVKIPENVEYIGPGCFEGCCNLSTCLLPNGILKIHETTFHSCIKLKSIDIPASVKVICGQAFAFSALQFITLPESIETIESKAFFGAKLCLIDLPKHISYIADDAFPPPKDGPLFTAYPGSYGYTWAREHGYSVKSAEV